MDTHEFAGSMDATMALDEVSLELRFDVHAAVLGSVLNLEGMLYAAPDGFAMYAEGDLLVQIDGLELFNLSATLDVGVNSPFFVELQTDFVLPGWKDAEVHLEGSIGNGQVFLAAAINDWKRLPGLDFDGEASFLADIGGSEFSVMLDVRSRVLGSALDVSGSIGVDPSGFFLTAEAHLGVNIAGLVGVDFDGSINIGGGGFKFDMDGALYALGDGRNDNTRLDLKLEIVDDDGEWMIFVGAGWSTPRLGLKVKIGDTDIIELGLRDFTINVGFMMGIGNSFRVEASLDVSGTAVATIFGAGFEHDFGAHVSIRFEAGKITILLIGNGITLPTLLRGRGG